jgi:hypothetical protein
LSAGGAVHVFQAIVLVCLATTAVDQCDERSALDVLSRRVDNELQCTIGWQDIIARTPLSADIGKTVYIRTICRREQ